MASLSLKLFFSKDAVENHYSLTTSESQVINILRTSMIIFVVYEHSLNFLGVANGFEPGALRTFHKTIFAMYHRGGGVAGIALFYSISAALLFRKPFSFSKNIKKKFFSLAIPYVFWNSFWIAVSYFMQLNSNLRATTLAVFPGANGVPVDHWNLGHWINAYIGFGQRWMPFLYPFWFVKDLIVLNLLAGVIKFLIDRFPIPSIVGLVLIVVFRPELYIVNYSSFVAFAVGYLVVRYEIPLSEAKKVPYALLIFLLFVGYALSFIHRLYALGFLVVLIDMYVLLVRLAFVAAEHKRVCDWFVPLSRISFLIFAFHEYTISLIACCIGHFFGSGYMVRFMEFLFLPVFAILMCAALYALLSKTNMMRALTGGR